MAKMTPEELLQFVEDIYRRAGDPKRAEAILDNLLQILREEQQESAVQTMMTHLPQLKPELSNAYKRINWKLDRAEYGRLEDQRKQREEQRRRWEEERARYGRCC